MLKPGVLIGLLWGLTLLPSLYFADQQRRENAVIRDFLNEHQLYKLDVSKDSAVQVSQLIRQEFNVDEASFVTLDFDDQPFLRHDTTFLLANREGACGEGTRVIVNLLLEMGFDATRLTMYDKYLLPSHTLVSIQLGEDTFFVDSINTRQWTNDFLNNNSISENDFALTAYSGSNSARIDARNRILEAETSDENSSRQRFFDRFWLYSFDAIPYTKLLSKIGYKGRVFNHSRPPKFLSSLAEKPNALLAVTTLIASQVLFVFGLIFYWWIFSRRNAR